MTLYRKKPIEVEAFRFGHEVEPAWYSKLLLSMAKADDSPTFYKVVKTPDGWQRCDKGDWLVKCSIGVFVRKHEVFIEFYETVE